MWDLLKSKVSNFIKQVKGDAEEEIKEIKIEEKPEPLRGMGHAYSPERMACHFPSENRQTTPGKGYSPSAVNDERRNEVLNLVMGSLGGHGGVSPFPSCRGGTFNTKCLRCHMPKHMRTRLKGEMNF